MMQAKQTTRRLFQGVSINEEASDDELQALDRV